MNNRILYSFFLLIFIFYPQVSAQVTFQSDTGSVYSGVVLNTDNFSKTIAIPKPENRVMENEFGINEPPRILPNINEPANSIYIEDKNTKTQTSGRLEGMPILLDEFPGIPMTNYIPPDPNVAVGPNHIVALVNSTFSIWDKEGNLLKSIDANQWFSPLYSSTMAGDPQIIYDNYSNRWVMVWHRATDISPSFLYTAVSDDDNPLGVWYAWALPGDYNGHISTDLWADYPHVGYDSQAIYITTNQFPRGAGSVYSRIRIISKAELYSSTGETLHYTDFWNISLPGSSNRVFSIAPTITTGSTSDYYLISAPSFGGNVLALYKISNSLTSPTLTGTNVSVSTFSPPPDADQLGGGNTPIESNDARISERAYFRNDTLWAVHAIRNPNQTSHSAISYYKINANTSTVIDDITFGSLGYYYEFPALTLDKDGNVCLTYSRSSENEYIGAYYSVLPNRDPGGYSGSIPLKEGKGNYVVTFGGNQNRWGDYMGVYLDPIDQNKFWVFTEYASATDTWGTWVGGIRTIPFNGPHLFVRQNEFNFGSVELGFSSQPQQIVIYNYGSEDVVITDVPATVGPFQIQNVPSGSVTISPYDSLTFEVTFTPDSVGFRNNTLTFTSNDPDFPGIDLFGNGYIINQVTQGIMYAATGNSNNGMLYSVDLLSGRADSIGSSDYDEVDYISKISINHHTHNMYGLYAQVASSYILRVNPTLGDAYILDTLNLANVQAIAFDTSAVLYAILKSGEIYTIDLSDGSYTQVADAGVNLTSIAFDPITNELYATAYAVLGSNRDLLYKIDLLSGVPTIIGHTGFNTVTNTIEFDAAGNLYGAIGAGNTISDFIQIDKTTGAGTLIGSTGAMQVTGLAFARTGVVGVEEPLANSQLPKDYSLKQNYPNPFNPSTKIEYTLPVAASVKVVIYNLLGEVINVLVNSQQNAGTHSVVWNSEDIHGNKVGSGVYFYEFKANGSNGSDFTQIRKMILLK